MATINLGDGVSVLVDSDIQKKLQGRSIYVMSNGCGQDYVYVTIGGRRCALHRIVMKPTPIQVVDHKDGNTLDNRRKNLRVCGHADNMANRKTNKDFIGVYYRPSSGLVKAQITKDKKTINLGNFPCRVSAALAYDHAARRLHGEFASLNFPDVEATDDLIEVLRGNVLSSAKRKDSGVADGIEMSR